MTENLTYKTIHGIKWNYISTIITAVMQIGYTAIMARLLEPAAFGLVAMAGVILRFGSYFAQMGIERAVIQKKEISQEDIRSSFTLSVFLGIIFFLLLWFLAPLALYVFNNEKVVIIVKVMALSFFISGFSTTSLGLLKRNLNFRSIAIIEIASYTLGYLGIGITMAVLDYGVWSLVFAALSQAFFSTVIAYILVRHSLNFTFKVSHYKPLFSFGSKVTIISIFEFLGGSLDTLIIGRFLGASLLGIYNRAFMIVNLPLQNFYTSITKVLFPSFSKIQSDRLKLKEAFLSSFTVSSFFLIPLCVWFSVSAKEIVLVILGNKWKEAIDILRILALVTPLYLMSSFMGTLFEAVAYLKVKLIFQIGFVILLGIALFITVPYGLIYAAAGLLGSAIIYHLGYIYLTKSLFPLSFKELISAYYPSIIASIITGFSILIVHYILIQINSSLIIAFSMELLFFAIIIILILRFSFTKRIKKILNDTLFKNLRDSILVRMVKKFCFV
ncbi:MAG: lipopolysaccharide biosynthesis protein [Ignavibacteriaceae bacterium]